jgi:hypothetical protein
MPLRYVLKCSYLIGVNEGNVRDKLLIALKLMKRALLPSLSLCLTLTS